MKLIIKLWKILNRSQRKKSFYLFFLTILSMFLEIIKDSEETGKVKIKLDSGIQSGKILRLKGKGLPSVNGYGKGDLLVHINVWTPQSLSKEEREFLEKCKKSDSFSPNPSRQDKSFFDRVKEMFGQ